MFVVARILGVQSGGQRDTVESAHVGDWNATYLCRARREHRHSCLEEQRADGGPQGKA
jgi:hypothetical protein